MEYCISAVGDRQLAFVTSDLGVFVVFIILVYNTLH